MSQIERLSFHSLSALIICLALALAIEGQTKCVVVSGSVVDQVRAIIPGAEVSLREQGNIRIFRKTTTNADGKFTFTDIPPGDYEIEIKTGWTNRSFRKQFNVNSGQPPQLDFAISLEPCFDEAASREQIPLTDSDRAAITRESINLRFPNFVSPGKLNLPKLIFSDENLQTAWLSPEQKERITVMSRFKIQALTENTGEFNYYSVSKINQRGSCVSVSLLENWTVKGQLEDANMAGGGTTYEFRKVDGRWIGIAFTSWVV